MYFRESLSGRGFRVLFWEFGILLRWFPGSFLESMVLPKFLELLSALGGYTFPISVPDLSQNMLEKWWVFIARLYFWLISMYFQSRFSLHLRKQVISQFFPVCSQLAFVPTFWCCLDFINVLSLYKILYNVLSICSCGLFFRLCSCFNLLYSEVTPVGVCSYQIHIYRTELNKFLINFFNNQ